MLSCYNINQKGGDEMSFPELLINFRAKHNLSQKELANILGTRQADISRYENESKAPTRVREIIFKNMMKEFEERKEG